MPHDTRARVRSGGPHLRRIARAHHIGNRGCRFRVAASRREGHHIHHWPGWPTTSRISRARRGITARARGGYRWRWAASPSSAAELPVLPEVPPLLADEPLRPAPGPYAAHYCGSSAQRPSPHWPESAWIWLCPHVLHPRAHPLVERLLSSTVVERGSHLLVVALDGPHARNPNSRRSGSRGPARRGPVDLSQRPASSVWLLSIASFGW